MNVFGLLTHLVLTLWICGFKAEIERERRSITSKYIGKTGTSVISSNPAHTGFIKVSVLVEILGLHVGPLSAR